METSRFDITFNNYELSPVHKDSPTLAKTAELFKDHRDLKVCDVGCGAGHFGLKLADFAEMITFVDPSAKMLSMLREKTTALQSTMDLEFINSTAEALPLPSGHFDVVLSRLAAHHFKNIMDSIDEMSRILKPGGYLIINDLTGSEDDHLDQINHNLEILHDPTHGRSYKPSEWKNFVARTGVSIETTSFSLESPAGITIDSWCSISKVGKEASNKIKEILHSLASAELTELGYYTTTDGVLNNVKTIYIVSRK
jgi:ubiquinone/menaquinone biosynthesis C-methylase UbiE